MPQFTRTQLLALRSPKCGWGTEEESLAGFEARFPGGASIDLGALIRSWLDDETLGKNTLYHCAAFARRAAKCRAGGARLNPKKCLETCLASLTSSPK